MRCISTINKVVVLIGRMFTPKVTDVMIRDFTTLDVGEPLMNAIKTVSARYNLRSVIIVSEGGLTGIS